MKRPISNREICAFYLVAPKTVRSWAQLPSWPVPEVDTPTDKRWDPEAVDAWIHANCYRTGTYRRWRLKPLAEDVEVAYAE